LSDAADHDKSTRLELTALAANPDTPDGTVVSGGPPNGAAISA
jgi:hypothetical protein